MECDICGEDKYCRFYKCRVGEITDYLYLCPDCVELQRTEGPVELSEDEYGVEVRDCVECGKPVKAGLLQDGCLCPDCHMKRWEYTR